ncbi:expressed unknown protein [Seminavis robusta]|uniref:Uncharacterized protein n=1 Tax=Seminavis robusta TaxID=568900 RepID=A0A9N8HNV4_9STRA|nr:expressed unknown protein [Seminavis robusta]|eukprot:Sro1258_g256850.1 n/a (182) ;mRNA; r:23036-23581
MKSVPVLLSVLSMLGMLSVVAGQASVQCLQESRQLEEDSFLDMIQDDLYNQYKADFDSICDFTGLTTPDCGLKFDGDNATYVAACVDKGGQVLTRPVVLKCGYSVATFNWDLGVAPTCVSTACNMSAIQPHELNDTRLEKLLTDLSITGCSADLSAANLNHGYGKMMVGIMALTTLVGIFI